MLRHDPTCPFVMELGGLVLLSHYVIAPVVVVAAVNETVDEGINKIFQCLPEIQ